MNIYEFCDYEGYGSIFVYSDKLTSAIRWWQKYIVEQSEGTFSVLDPPEPTRVEMKNSPGDLVEFATKPGVIEQGNRIKAARTFLADLRVDDPKAQVLIENARLALEGKSGNVVIVEDDSSGEEGCDRCLGECGGEGHSQR